MKKKTGQKLLTAILAVLSSAVVSMTAMAAETTGALTSADASGIKGWAWNKGMFDETVHVELHIYKDDSEKAAKVITVSADSYDADLSKAIGDGYHAFESSVDWSELGGTSYTIEAYAMNGEDKLLLSDPLEYVPSILSVPAKPEDDGPGVPMAEKPVSGTETAYEKGQSLGIFSTTAYCACANCSGGHSLTYSGTVPQPNHTISADIDVLPIGTKVMIGDIVYTVEDIGSSVDGQKIDIFFGSHEEALDYGRQSQEVFTVIAR